MELSASTNNHIRYSITLKLQEWTNKHYLLNKMEFM